MIKFNFKIAKKMLYCKVLKQKMKDLPSQLQMLLLYSVPGSCPTATKITNHIFSSVG